MIGRIQPIAPQHSGALQISPLKNSKAGDILQKGSVEFVNVKLEECCDHVNVVGGENGEDMIIHFTSDGSIADTGFLLKWKLDGPLSGTAYIFCYFE